MFPFLLVLFFVPAHLQVIITQEHCTVRIKASPAIGITCIVSPPSWPCPAASESLTVT